MSILIGFFPGDSCDFVDLSLTQRQTIHEVTRIRLFVTPPGRPAHPLGPLRWLPFRFLVPLDRDRV